MLTPLLAAIAPAAVAAIFFFAFAKLSRTRFESLGASIGVALGSILGLWLVLGRPSVPPREAAGWLPYWAIALLLLALVDRAIAREPLRLLARGVALLFMLLVMLQPLIRNAWSAQETVLHIAAFATIILMTWASYDAGATREHMLLIALQVLLVCIGGSVITLFAGTAKLAQLSGSVTSALGGAGVIAVMLRSRNGLGGTLAVAWPLACLIWIQAYCFAEASLPPMIVLIAAALAVWAASIPRSAAAWKRATASGVVTLLMLAFAIALAYRSYTASEW